MAAELDWGQIKEDRKSIRAVEGRWPGSPAVLHRSSAEELPLRVGEETVGGAEQFLRANLPRLPSTAYALQVSISEHASKLFQIDL